MDLCFVDDSCQLNPSRPGMGPLIATGSIHVNGSVVETLEKKNDQICSETGFPPNEEYKWSPRRELWMYSNLIGDTRRDFFLRVLDETEEKEVQACVVVEDKTLRPANQGRSAEDDVTIMLLERIEKGLQACSSEGIVIADSPAGGRTDEHKFLSSCLETIQNGTDYVKPTHISINVVSTPSRLVRLLQLADLVTSCTLARVSGEREYSPIVFANIKEMLVHEGDRIGGYGLKIQPAFRYANLYHWLLGDSHFWYKFVGNPLPHRGIPYYEDEHLN